MSSSRSFSEAELACKCGCGATPPQDAVDWLQGIRDEFGMPMHLSSAMRCPDHNARESSTGRDGPHTKEAFDVKISGAAALRLIEVALKHGAQGIGVAQKGAHSSRFIHLDRLNARRGYDGPRPWIWSY